MQGHDDDLTSFTGILGHGFRDLRLINPWTPFCGVINYSFYVAYQAMGWHCSGVLLLHGYFLPWGSISLIQGRLH